MTALWFSGGKDSLACLLLHRHELQDIHVLWANTGKYLPEHVSFVEKFKPMCPNWHEVRTDRDAQNARFGLPADVVPVNHTLYGEQFTSAKAVRVQPYLQCCHDNISGPLWDKTKELGCTTVIRGQRRDESHRSPFEHGSSFDGVRFVHPVEGWSTARVKAYVAGEVDLPEHFALEHTSIDCFDCTAFLEHCADRAAYMKARHPKHFAIFHARLTQLEQVIAQATRPVYEILEASR